MKRLFLVNAVISAILILGIIGCSQPATPPASPTTQAPTSASPKPSATPTSSPAANVINIKTSHSGAVGYQMHVYHQYWKEAIENYTNGRVNVTIYPMSQLFKQEDELNALQAGSIDFSTTAITYLEPAFPPLGVISIAFLFNNRDHKIRFYNAARDVLVKMYAEKGVKYLGETEFSSFAMWNNVKPLTKMEDWKGLKVRASGPQQEYVQAWGASGVMVTSAEAVMALQQGMVQGYLGTASLIVTSKLTAYLKYGTNPHEVVFWGHVPQIMSMKTWNSLPADIQNIIETKVAPEVQQRSLEYLNKSETADYDAAAKEGIKFDWFPPAELDKMRAASQPIVTKQLDKLGPVAKQMYDLVQKTR